MICYISNYVVIGVIHLGKTLLRSKSQCLNNLVISPELKGISKLGLLLKCPQVKGWTIRKVMGVVGMGKIQKHSCKAK